MLVLLGLALGIAPGSINTGRNVIAAGPELTTEFPTYSVSDKLISDCIRIAWKYETAVPVTPSIDSVLESSDGQTCRRSLPRSEMFITQAPQGYTMRKIMWAHEEAEKRNILNPISSSELLIELGEEVHIFIGDRDNIKVTTPEDLRFLRAYYYYRQYENFAREDALYGTKNQYSRS